MLYKHILGETLRDTDLEFIDPDQYRALKNVLSYEGDIADILVGNVFVFEDHSVTPPAVVPLKPNGNRIPVTNTNRGEYATLKAQFILQKAMEAQLQALCDGLFAVADGIGSAHEWGLSSAELRLLLCGKCRVDLDELRQLTKCGCAPDCDDVLRPCSRVLKRDRQLQSRLLTAA